MHTRMRINLRQQQQKQICTGEHPEFRAGEGASPIKAYAPSIGRRPCSRAVVRGGRVRAAGRHVAAEAGVGAGLLGRVGRGCSNGGIRGAVRVRAGLGPSRPIWGSAAHGGKRAGFQARVVGCESTAARRAPLAAQKTPAIGPRCGKHTVRRWLLARDRIALCPL